MGAVATLRYLSSIGELFSSPNKTRQLAAFESQILEFGCWRLILNEQNFERFRSVALELSRLGSVPSSGVNDNLVSIADVWLPSLKKPLAKAPRSIVPKRVDKAV
jgi:hypothetical protein